MKEHVSKLIVKASILCFFLLVAAHVKGQGWIRTYGGDGDQGQSQVVVPTFDGGITIFSGGQGFVNSISEQTLYILRLDSNGNIVFEKDINFGDFSIVPLDVKPLSNGGFIIGGGTEEGLSSMNAFLMEIDSLGQIVWKKIFANSNPNQWGWGEIISIEIVEDGYLLSGARASDAFFMKTDKKGNIVWEKFTYTIESNFLIIDISDFVIDDDFVVTGYGQSSAISHQHTWFAKLDSNGEITWENLIVIDTLNSYRALNIINTNQKDGYLITGRINGPNEFGVFCLKTDHTGEVEWVKTWSDSLYNLPYAAIIPANMGGYYIISSNYSNTDDLNVLLIKIDDNGNTVWQKNYGTIEYEDGQSLFQNPDGSLILCGTAIRTDTGEDVFLIKTDSEGNVYSSAVQGFVQDDSNSDCLFDSTDTGFKQWLVRSTGEFYSSTITDENGFYSLPIDTGIFEIEAVQIGPYWDICNSHQTINISTFYDTTNINFPVQAVDDCPFLEVSMTTPFLRRCFDNTYTVQYCNYGTIPAEDANVEITLDTFLTYLSSTIPLINQNGNTLSFDLDSVDVNECGSFQITVFLDCDSTILGQTHCTEAHIFPDSLCLPPSALWDSSSVEVDVACVGDSVIFTIQNTGSGNMSQPLDYIIIEDQIVLLQGDFQLDAGESITVSVLGNGSTFHLEAEQSPEHPSGANSTGATIEGCGGWVSLGFFTQFSNPEASPFVDIDCHQSIGSYDPNDKQAFPAGFGDEHLIEPETDLEYLIRFQNTGTDTAFKVVIVDVLPEGLDLATLRPGASSHPYEYSVSPEGWPIFTFNDIMLPDSNVNEAASHGFVRFNISQAEGNGHGTYIENTALIYFDFNPPIQTNTVLHKVGQIFPWTFVGAETPIFEKPQIRIMPNPLTDSALLQLDNAEPGLLHLLLVTPSGQVVRDEKAFGTGFEIRRGDLPSGIYFFKITRDGVYVGSGKLMVQ